LEYLHSEGIAHLDIKLDNLVLDENFQLKIIDFDRSYKKEDLFLIGKGTANYRAPELFTEKCTNPFSTDIYSAAIVLFVLFNGKHLPYNEGSLFREIDLYVLLQQNPNKFWSVHETILKSSFPCDFKELFIGMTRGDVDKRFTLEDVKSNSWYNGEIYTPEEMKEKLSPKKIAC
jgi:serine/threonine protein kinase